ncbi:MAG: hypothetical protein GPJ54_03060 [Candidatus Heimdallarchaeota archaeon]|nr:hypothetical protein [Candidatus Heimdallarchaeota archaeon]
MADTTTQKPFKRGVRTIQIIAIFLLFIFSVAPLVLAAFPNSTTNTSFSIYNTEYDGLSIVRNDIEGINNAQNTAKKYNVSTSISNLNILNRFNGSGALVIVGPAADFTATETFSVLLYLLRGGSLIIADDFGTGNQILEPIFDLFENLDSVCENAAEQGIVVPCMDDLLSGQSNDTGLGLSPDQFDAPVAGDLGGIDPGNFLLSLLSVVKAFGFNSSAVLMDATSNTGNPANPLITDIEHTEIEGMTFTQGVNRVQMEYGSIISIKLQITEDVFDPDTGNTTEVTKTVWQPLQKISASLINDAIPAGDDNFDLGLPFFPLYSSKSSWMESNFDEATDGTAQPNLDEWGNAKFATALSIPLMPGMGKIVFVADASIFINRWTEQTDKNDNLIMIRNIIEMATSHQVPTLENPQIPIIFDFGHTYQSFTSPALYSTALLKLIAEMSMFPLYAPFVPFMAYGYGKKLMPENRRLRPILLTKRRGLKGQSEFEKKLNEIKASGGYGEPIAILATALVRRVRSDPRFEGTFAKNPNEMAIFFTDNYASHVSSRRELSAQLKIIFRIAEHSTKQMSIIAGKKHLTLLKKLLDMLN